ncbi:hypothetical protein B0H17DRAFT_1190960 [Mycena rosella]|uniref:Core-binding (CB) domain-containing protein n=1 Tax=Mycena rosella TaxID=1033263 RepID=A0AAD7MBS8_MYCRO|nr:hypothetical protein B0H17DRAFT_1190960 [Mycena rosella]
MCSPSTVRDAVNNALHENTRSRYGSFNPGTHTHARTSRRNQLSASAAAKVQLTIKHAWAESTLKKYGQGFAAFEQFCDSEAIPFHQQLPADEYLLCAFAASRAGEVAGVTARGAIAAVKAWHIMNDTPWKGGIRLRYTLRGVKNLTPASFIHDQRPPVTAAMLEALDKNLDCNDPRDAAVFVSACCAFWGQIRIGEILSETQKSFIPGRIPLVSDLAPPTSRAGSRVLKLPHTKTKGNKGDAAMLCRQRGTSDPINAVENHLCINNIPDNLPLFSHRNRAGGLICLTRKKLMLQCNEIWSALSFPVRTGHSFCTGGTTELLLAGVSPAVVQAMGRWLSDAFLVYWLGSTS